MGELDLEKEKKLKLEMILENTNHEEQLGATQESFVQGYMTPSYSFVPAARIICLPSMWIQNGSL
jgi:hypothetical protein